MPRLEGSDDLADEVMTAQEVADFLKITRHRLYQLQIPCSVLGAKTRRYLRSDVIAFLKKKRFGRVS